MQPKRRRARRRFCSLAAALVAAAGCGQTVPYDQSEEGNAGDLGSAEVADTNPTGGEATPLPTGSVPSTAAPITPTTGPATTASKLPDSESVQPAAGSTTLGPQGLEAPRGDVAENARTPSQSITPEDLFGDIDDQTDGPTGDVPEKAAERARPASAGAGLMPWQAKGGANTPPADDKKFEQLFAEVMGGAAPDASAGGGVDAGLDGAAVANGSDAPAPPPTLPAADPPAPTTDSVADSFFDPPASEGPQPSLPAAVTESPAALDWQPTRPAATPQPKPPARAGEPTRVATARPSPPGISDTLAGDPPPQRRPLPALPPTPVDIDNTR
ncbi:MAG: hypothetical protein AAGB00_11320, partial [Planctomycetota bacterium]